MSINPMQKATANANWRRASVLKVDVSSARAYHLIDLMSLQSLIVSFDLAPCL